jgi:uncharacterized protein (DUF2235 family)
MHHDVRLVIFSFRGRRGMTRRVILLSDGTGNSAAKVWRTNVWRVFESLDLSGDEQVAFYDDGVGTSAFKPLAIIGGAFGYGLKRNVIDIYKFACRNVRSNDDELFAFGFSRGAFTIRVVTGLIHSQGLVQTDSEIELDALAKAAYRAYRADKFHTYWRYETVLRWIRDLFIRSKYDASKNLKFTNVRFLGLWDTVAAYGLPIEEMTIGVSKWIWPLELPDHDLNPDVKRACHALSIDDERTTFHPVLWNERKQAPGAPDEDGKVWTTSQRLTQVWFSGVHSNVGGGYPDDSLAHIPLVWMMREADKCGLVFKTSPHADPDSFVAAQAARDKDGRQYDPRAGLGMFYRYGPRNIAELCSTVFSEKRNDEVYIETPKIHETVFARTKSATSAYAPIGLPARYAIVADNGEVVDLAASKFETEKAAAARANAQEAVWNLVTIRRFLYFTTMLVVAYLFVYPLMHAPRASAELESPIRWASDAIRLIGGVLPGLADPWINGYARTPDRFLATVIVISALLFATGWVGARAAARMRGLWRQSLAGSTTGALPADPLFRLRTKGWYVSTRRNLKRRVTPTLYAIGLSWLALGLASHLLYDIQDDAGFVCIASKSPRIEPKQGKPITFTFDLKDICPDSGITLQEGKTYRMSVATDGGWKDDTFASGIGGFYTTSVPSAQVPVYLAGLPLRRELTRPWFRVVARFGSTGGEEKFFDPSPDPEIRKIEAKFHAPRDGELFVFVNDAVLPWPLSQDFFYRNNHGVGTVTIERVDP